jgi:dihydroxyacid dehydratase/phosphogluconate dehydratase
MGAALSMNALAEGLGMSLPGCACWSASSRPGMCLEPATLYLDIIAERGEPRHSH